ncbi:MAG TPA: DUF488 domain-containing protein [Rhizomicrobium sp.]
MTIKVKRVYEPAERGDGLRVLVDRLWPRGVAKADIDLWLKDIAPSTELREWFGHVPSRWPSFRAKYHRELAKNPAVADLRRTARGKTVTLLYGAKDTVHNQAQVLAAFLAKPVSKTKVKVPPSARK